MVNPFLSEVAAVLSMEPWHAMDDRWRANAVQRAQLSAAVLCVKFAPRSCSSPSSSVTSANHIDSEWIVAGTTLGTMHAFNILPDGTIDTAIIGAPFGELVSARRNPVYDMAFISRFVDSEGPVLLACGDEFCVAISWTEFIQQQQQQQQPQQQQSTDKNRISSAVDRILPLRTLTRLSAPALVASHGETRASQFAGFNAICVSGSSSGNSRVFCATGHGQIIMWDPENGSQAVFAAVETGIALLSLVLCEQQQELIVGGEDGVVRIWSISPESSESMPRVAGATLNPYIDSRANAHVVLAREDAPSTKGGSSRQLALDRWITALAVDPSGSWLACGGGSGLLSVWHLPTRCTTAAFEVRADTQAVAFGICTSLDGLLLVGSLKVVAGGNTGVLSHWRHTGQFLATEVVESASTFALALSDTSGMVVSGGTAPALTLHILGHNGGIRLPLWQ